MITEAILQVNRGQSLTAEQMTEVMDLIMTGKSRESEIRELLVGIHNKGESVDELVGAARAMRKHMRVIRSSEENVVDTCGTGGGNSKTFNISTAAAIVAAAAGAIVAKHGNRKSTSRTGSADVLAELGVNVQCSPEVAEKCLNRIGLCFCFAPLLHPSVKQVMSVRQSLSHPTIFNLLGPLCNPAKAAHQVLGAGRGETRQKLAQALAKLGTTRSIVVHSKDGLGEITVGESTFVSEVVGGKVTEGMVSPRDFGLNTHRMMLISAVDPADSADKIRRLLKGQQGAARDIVVANAAATLWVSGLCDSLAHGAERCESAIDNGQAGQTLQELVKLTNLG